MGGGVSSIFVCLFLLFEEALAEVVIISLASHCVFLRTGSIIIALPLHRLHVQEHGVCDKWLCYPSYLSAWTCMTCLSIRANGIKYARETFN
jgi:hypothetical protein